MTLRELLHYIEFDAELDENKEIRLIDQQNVYLGTIGEERWEAKQDSVPDIIDRLSIYWNDYVITPLEEDMSLGCDDYDTWEDLYKLACEIYGDKVNENTILGYVLGKLPVELDKELLND